MSFLFKIRFPRPFFRDANSGEHHKLYFSFYFIYVLCVCVGAGEEEGDWDLSS